MSKLLLAVDRFIVMEGVVICDGWFSGLPKNDSQLELLFDGEPLSGQQLVSVDRPDLVEHIQRDRWQRLREGRDAPRRWGFCLRALLPLPRSRGDAHNNPWGGESDDCHRRLSLRGRARGEELLVEDPGQSLLEQISQGDRALFQRFRQAIAENPAPRILEIGSRGDSPERVMGGALPAAATYIGLDYHPGENVHLVGDAHRLSELVREPVDFVFSMSTFEHLLMPWKAAVEIARVLRVGGLAFIHSHGAWPIHEVPHDFLRFSKYAWAAFFNRCTGFELLDAIQSDPAVIAPALQTHTHPHFIGLSRGVSYLTSICLARKVADPLVDWPVGQDEILATAYPFRGQAEEV